MMQTTHETPSMMNEEVTVSPADTVMATSPSPVKKTRSNGLRRLRKYEAMSKSPMIEAKSPKDTATRKKKGGKGKKKINKTHGDSKRKGEELDTPPAKRKKVSNSPKGKNHKMKTQPVCQMMRSNSRCARCFMNAVTPDVPTRVSTSRSCARKHMSSQSIGAGKLWVSNWQRSTCPGRKQLRKETMENTRVQRNVR